MNDAINNPHDYFFRTVFSRPEIAKSFLINYVAPEIAAKFDVETLETTQESFVDAEMKPHHTDLLFRVKLKNADDAFVFVLLEHKSYPDEFVAFQLLRYIVRIWEKSLREKVRKLPPILPIVFYHGKTKWKISREFVDLVENSNALENHTPRFEYDLCDLSAIDANNLKGEAFLQAAMFALQNIFDKNLNERLFDLWQLFKLKDEKEVIEFIGIVIRYILAGNKFITRNDVTKSLKQAFAEKEQEIMTPAIKEILEEGVQQGLETGLQQGLQKGLQQGLQQGLANQAIRFLKKKLNKFDANSIENINRLSAAQLEKLGDDLSDFETVDDLKEWLKKNSN